MMVVCQSHSCKLVVEGRTLYFSSVKEKREAAAFYARHGFKVGASKRR